MNVEQNRIFLLSPASSGGKRAALLLNDRATFDIATRVRSDEGAPLGDVFSFLSGLYFRGKLTYAQAFASPPPSETSGVHLITATDGLWSPTTRVTLSDLERFATVPIDAKEPRYRLPLERDAERLAESVGEGCDVVLLGSIATRKYLDVLEPIFGDRLLFPMEFIGHGDMARGAMLLKRAALGAELTYWPVSKARNQNSRLRISLKKRSCS
ncbi:MAG TPA: hypothetical protein VNG73_00430 [Gemmatimonadaceae bacterium]|nr:hypothetical protein [Gemmatimonadaceae bacterium]